MCVEGKPTTILRIPETTVSMMSYSIGDVLMLILRCSRTPIHKRKKTQRSIQDEQGKIHNPPSILYHGPRLGGETPPLK